jgi:Lon protease-like protein
VPEDLRRTAHALAQVLATLRSREPDAAQTPAPAALQLQDCGWVANRWCELLPVPLDLKQRLMALDNPLLRLELVGDVLEKTGIAQ